ncbi:MAG: hypothetical protein ABSG62_14010 [Terracidiphilus sp.]|jgi:hypothetical protein
MAIRYAVIMVADFEPDTFTVLAMDIEAGGIKSTSEFMSETDMRKFLKDQGMPKDEINRQIIRARNDPK